MISRFLGLFPLSSCFEEWHDGIDTTLLFAHKIKFYRKIAASQISVKVPWLETGSLNSQNELK